MVTLLGNLYHSLITVSPNRQTQGQHYLLWVWTNCDLDILEEKIASRSTLTDQYKDSEYIYTTYWNKNNASWWLEVILYMQVLKTYMFPRLLLARTFPVTNFFFCLNYYVFFQIQYGTPDLVSMWLSCWKSSSVSRSQSEELSCLFFSALHIGRSCTV